MPRVVVAPDAATRLAVAAEWLAAQPLDAEVLVVGPTWEACDDLVRSAVVQARARLASVRERELVAALARRAPEVLATAPRGDARTIAQLEAALGCAAEAARPRRRSGSLGALQEHLFEDSTPPRAGLDETVTLRSWPGEAREAVEIARAVQAAAARGVPFDRMAVLLRSPTDYREHLEEAFRRAAIPAFFARGTRRPDPGGRALLALLACAADKLSARPFA